MKKKQEKARQVRVYDVQSIFSEGDCEFVTVQDEREAIAELRYWQEKEFNFNHQERE